MNKKKKKSGDKKLSHTKVSYKNKRLITRKIDETTLLNTLINSMPDHIYVKDLNHRFILCNKAVAENIGFDSPEDIIGKTDVDFFPPHLVKQYIQDEKKIFKTGIPLYNREEEVVDAIGNVNYVLTNKVPIFDKKGKVIGLFGINRNITELKKLREKEKKYIETIKRELALAWDIQRGFLPESLPFIEGWNIAAFFTPAHDVSGDFYQTFLLNDSVLLVTVGDVSGKNISAAIFMSHVITLIKAFTEMLFSEGKNPLDSIELINKYICQYNPVSDLSAKFVTLFLGIINLKDGSMEYINAGHIPPYFISQNKQYFQIMPTSPAIGISKSAIFNKKKIQFTTGDLLFIYTDGVTEAKDLSGYFFSDLRLKNILINNNTKVQILIEAVKNAVNKFCEGCEKSDDITILAIKRE